MRLRGRKDRAERIKKFVVGRIVGPEGKDAFRLQMRSERTQPTGRIEGAVACVEQVARGVIDIQKNGVKATTGRFGIEPRGRSSERKEISMDESASWIAGQRGADRDEAAPVPVDDRPQRINDDQLPRARMFQRRHRGVAEPESSHDDIPRSRLERRQTEIGERDFDVVEEARHEKRVAELHLEDFEIVQRAHSASAQREVAERRGLEIEFGKIAAHERRAEGETCATFDAATTGNIRRIAETARVGVSNYHRIQKARHNRC